MFGLDDDGPDVFSRTVEWGISQSLETATFHIMTPYPGTALHRAAGRRRPDCQRRRERYDAAGTWSTRRLRMSPEQLEAGYWRAYRDYYRWRAIARGAAGQDTVRAAAARHLAYAGGWKRLEPMWDLVIRSSALARCCRCSSTRWTHSAVPGLGDRRRPHSPTTQRCPTPRPTRASPVVSPQRAGVDNAGTSHRSARRVRCSRTIHIRRTTIRPSRAPPDRWCADPGACDSADGTRCRASVLPDRG